MEVKKAVHSRVDLAARLGNLLIVGGGKMGEAVIAGLARLDGYDMSTITVADHKPLRCEELAQRYGVNAVLDASSALPVNTVLLAVKPQAIRNAIAPLAAHEQIAGALVISIAAGITTATLEALFPSTVAVVRVMPNTPLLCGQGMSTVSAGLRADEGATTLVCDLFASMGRTVVIDESLQDVSCALNGSGPAYFALMVDALAREGERHGLDSATALELATQTMLGTAYILQSDGQDPNSLINAVSSPGGTTVAALEAMRSAGIEQAIEAGVQAAIQRSKELA